MLMRYYGWLSTCRWLIFSACAGLLCVAFPASGEVIIRTWQTAHKMKVQRGSSKGDPAVNDNGRVKHYIAKYTINPAITHGMAHVVGSIEEGKLAAAAMGDPNASIPTPQPVHYRPMFGSFGKALNTSVTFISKAAVKSPAPQKLGLSRPLIAVKNTRRIGKRNMIHNDWQPRIDVDPETYQVRAGGELLKCELARVLPLAQRYFLF